MEENWGESMAPWYPNFRKSPDVTIVGSYDHPQGIAMFMAGKTHPQKARFLALGLPQFAYIHINSLRYYHSFLTH